MLERGVSTKTNHATKGITWKWRHISYRFSNIMQKLNIYFSAIFMLIPQHVLDKIFWWTPSHPRRAISRKTFKIFKHT